MFQRGARRTTYGVYVRFRKSRLPMRRGLVRLEEAVAIAEMLRRERLHGPDDVFVIREPDGVQVDVAAEMRSAAPSEPPAPSEPAAPSEPPAPAVEPAAGANGSANDGAPEAGGALVNSGTTGAAGGGLVTFAGAAPARQPRGIEGTTLLLLLTGLERARRATARHAQVHAHFERTTEALAAALQRADAPPRLVRQQAQMQALRALVASAAASFDRATAIAEARLGGPWIEVGASAARRPAPPSDARV